MKNSTLSLLKKAALACSLVLSTFVGKAQTYCSIGGSTTCAYGDYIQSFSTTSATTNITNNSSGCVGTTPSYIYYSSQTMSAVQGTTFNFSITNGSYPYEYFRIWIDWNDDGDFTDAGETVYSSSQTSSGGQVMTGTITVPATATVSATRMRVMCSYGGLGSPCSTYYSDGEVEDYNFNVLAACTTPSGLTVSNITSSTADFNWTAVSGTILGYEYVVDQVSTNPTTAGTLITTNSYSEAGLTSSTAYYFHVRTKCGQSSYSNWSTIPFTTIFNPCTAPSGISFMPTGTSVANFSWAAVAGSTGYEYIVKSSPSSPTVSGTSTTSTTATESGLVGGNTYYFFLRNLCSTTSKSDWVRYAFTMPECYKPGQILVTSYTDTSADFIWGTTSNANFYEYQVDQIYAHPSGGSGFSLTSGMTAHVEGLIPLSKYYIHLRSRCFSADTSEWVLDSLTTAMGCLRPQVIITGRNTNSPSARWDAVPHAVAYEYKVSTSASAPSFGTDVFATALPPFNLAADGKDYYLHIRTKCNSQFSFSSWVTEPLRVTPTSVSNVTGDIFDINVYPNPVKDVLQISIGGNIREEAVLTLMDITGKIVARSSMTDKNTEIDMSNLASGIYMLKYANDIQTQTIKVTKQ